MAKSKLTLIVDGNWLLMSRLYVTNNKFESKEQKSKGLKLLLAQSINVVLRNFPEIDNVIFVADGGSWRNTEEVPSFLKTDEIEYKGNREKSSDIDWDIVFKSYEEFIDELAQTGVQTLKERYIEGDDWMCYLSNKLNSENTNVIIWSTDKDLTQLVKTNKDNCFTVCWDKSHGVTAQLVNKDTDIDFFFNPNYNDNAQLYEQVISHGHGLTEIDPSTVVIDKIIRGDAGDNILPILTKSSTTGKKYKVATKDLDLNINIYDDQSIKNYIQNLLNNKSYAGKVDQSYEEIYEHFKYNVKLVTLQEKNYPDWVKDIFNKYTEFAVSRDISKLYEKLLADKNSINSILESI